MDCLFVGPFDLGNNIGHPIMDGKMDDELSSAIATIQRSAKEHDKRTGIYCTSGDQARHYADQGFHMVGELTTPIELRLIPVPDLCRSGYDCSPQLSDLCPDKCERLVRSFCVEHRKGCGSEDDWPLWPVVMGVVIEYRHI